MIYLLDTDVLIFVIRGLKKSSRRLLNSQAGNLVNHCKKAQSEGNSVGLSAISVSELEFGARKGGRYDAEIDAVRKILAPFDIYDYDTIRCPYHYGSIRQELELKGAIIGSMDLLIAAHVLALDGTLISNNLKHFSRISSLKTTNWL